VSIFRECDRSKGEIIPSQVYKNTTPGLAVDFTKEQGRSLKVANLPDAIALFFPVASEPVLNTQLLSSQAETTTVPPPTDCGLPRSTLLPILRGIHAEITKIRDVYSTIEMRTVGGSFLIVYEADWARAAEGVEQLKKEQARQSEVVDDDHEEEEEEEDDDAEEEGTIPFTVKLIDFAHTHMTPGDGPDEGVVQGMDKVLELIGERINHLENSQSA